MSNNNNKQQDANNSTISNQCQQCVQMLTNVLKTKPSSTSNNSRAFQLLKSMSSSTSKTTTRKDGVVVQLALPSSPNQETTTNENVPLGHGHRRRHSTTARISPNRSGGTVTTTSAAAATSSMLSSRANDGTNHVKQQQQQEQHQHVNNDTNNNNTTTTIPLKITCRPCGTKGPEGGARAFVMGPNPLSVVLCSNRLSSRDEMDQVLVHELIHVFDVMQLKLDLRQCHNLAYSEVRAAKQAECYGYSHNFFTSLPQKLCIQNKATIATQNLFPMQGKQCVSQVLSKAMADNRPFSSCKQQEPDTWRASQR